MTHRTKQSPGLGRGWTPISIHHKNIFRRVKYIPVPEVIAHFLPSLEQRRTGRNWIGRCPFHADRKPSFVIYPNGWKCFGCGEHGDGVDLVARLLNVRPLEAARVIMHEFGMPVDEPQTRATIRKAEQIRAVARQERDLETALQAYRHRVYRDLCFIHQAATRVAARGTEEPAAPAAAFLEVYVSHLLDVLEYGTPAEQLEVLGRWDGSKCVRS